MGICAWLFALARCYRKHSTEWKIYENGKYIREGSKLIWVASEECLYYTNAVNARLNAIACTCYEDDCRARILNKNDNTAVREFRSMPHISHGSMYNKYKKTCLFVFMKKRCLSAPASATTKDIYDEAVLMLRFCSVLFIHRKHFITDGTIILG